jgi:ABC-2 type transport system ATP-binding protein
VLAQGETRRNLLVAQAFGDESEDLGLAPGQHGTLVWAGSRLHGHRPSLFSHSAQRGEALARELELVGNPELLFLDEPTTGFDPAARHQFWGVIRGLRELGKTVLLTTHYMDEAQQLADRVAVISKGVVVAEGTPDQLGGRERMATRVRFTLPAGTTMEELPETLEGAELLESGSVELKTDAPVPTLKVLTLWADARGFELADLQVTRRSLEEIYLELTEGGTR